MIATQNKTYGLYEYKNGIGASTEATLTRLLRHILYGNWYEDGEGGLVPPLTYYMSSIQRFDPVYWRAEGPQTASFSISSYENGFEVAFESRLKSDFVGIVWDSEDTKDHQYLRYDTNYDYSGLVWEFDIELSPTMPLLNDPQSSPTLTIHYVDEQDRKGIAYVALFNYTTTPSSRDAHIVIDFDTVKGGYDNTTNFNVRYIEKMFLGGYVSEYESSAVPLAQTTSGYVRVTNMVLTGALSATTLPLYRVNIQDHTIGMCTSYDDHYDLNPKRIVNNLKALGYSGFINHYCGMSHYPVMDWDFTHNRFYIPDTLVDGRDVVNLPTKKWHQGYANALKEEGFEPVFSVSWELYSQAAREEWCQREWDDSIGRTGYTPPSYFASLCNPNAIAYLHKAYKEFADILVAANLPVNMQIGEPWWWFNVNTLKPCVYDYPTKLAFNADTGLFAPNLGTIYEAVNMTDPTSQAFKDWLRNKLGQTCQDIRTMIKTEYGSSAKVCPLLFFPSIRTHQESLATYINYPQEHYAYPNFDYLMTEAYDWIIEQPPRLDLSHQAVNEIPIDELGYAPADVAYLSGFVPDAAIAYIYKFDYTQPYRLPIWRRIFGDIKNNENVGVMKQLVWAYPQVMYDSLTIDGRYDGFFSKSQYFAPIQINTPYPEEIRGEGLSPWQPEPILKPIDITAVLHANYDITINFNVENEVAGATYEVQILNQTGVYSLWTKFTDTHSATITSQELSDLGLGTLLKVLVVPSVGEVSTIVDIEAVAE